MVNLDKFIGSQASKIYGQGDHSASVNLLVPRNKFQFQVNIDYWKGTEVKSLQLNRIADIQMPSHNPKTQVINQYNKKRVVQMGVEYVPIMLTAYDTRDAEIENFLIEYNNHYYANPMSDNINKMKDDIVPTSDNGYSGKGFQLTDKRYFIKKITITRESSTDDKNIIEVYNPIISSIQTDSLSYAESTPVQYRIEFTYEGYHIVTNGTPPKESSNVRLQTQTQTTTTETVATQSSQQTIVRTTQSWSINPTQQNPELIVDDKLATLEQAVQIQQGYLDDQQRALRKVELDNDRNRSKYRERAKTAKRYADAVGRYIDNISN